jgi:hypothetical protein
MRRMKRLTPLLVVLLVALIAACQPPIDQSVDDLKSNDPAQREKAVERLAEDGQSVVARLASQLSTDDPEELKATFEVLRRLGDKALPEMVKKIGYVWRGKEVLAGFVDFFSSQGDLGYQTLLDELLAAGDAAGAEATAKGSMVKLEGLYHHLESLSLVMEMLPTHREVGEIPKLLVNPYSRVRQRAAYLLCLKGWTPGKKVERVVFFTHLATTLECAAFPEPVNDAAQIAAEDLEYFLQTDKQYPAPGDSRYKVLAAAATDEVAEYVYKTASKTDNEFLLFNLFGVLKAMENEAGTKYAKKLLADSRQGKSLRSLDPSVGSGL